MKVKKVEGLKNKGARIPSWQKLGDQDSKSAKKAPHDQLKGGSAKKIGSKDNKDNMDY